MRDYELEEAEGWQLFVPKNQPMPRPMLGQSRSPRLPPPSLVGGHGHPKRRSRHNSNMASPDQNTNSEPGRNHALQIEAAGVRYLATTLVIDRDNAACIAWRRNEPYRETWRFPKNFLHTKIKESTVSSILAGLSKISYRTGTHIALTPLYSSQIAVNIWGTPQNVSDACVQLRKLSNDLVDKFGWAHIPSPSLEQRQLGRRLLLDESKRQQYRQAPLDTVNFPSSGHFRWPTHEYEPAEVFGQSFEALDPIRSEQRCYVTYDARESTFSVYGDDLSRTKNALGRLRTTYFQLLARKIEFLPNLYLFYPLTGESLRQQIRYKPYLQTEQPKTPPKVTVEIHGPPMLGPARSLREATSVQVARSNTSRAERYFLRSLNTLRYTRGLIRMRARLGTFILTKYKTGDCIPLSEFEEMTADECFAAIVTDGLGNKALEDGVFLRISHATDVFIPGDASNKILMDVKPRYSCRFVIANPDGPGNLRVEAEFIIEDGVAVQVAMKCSRSMNTPKESQKFMNMTFVNVSRPLAWGLEISASQIFDHKKSAAVRAFTDSIQLNCKVATNRKQSQTIDLFRYRSSSILIKSFQHIRSWKYYMRNGPYVCEIAQVQDFTNEGAQPRDSAYQHIEKTDLPQITLSIYNEYWDTLLAENEDLAVGRDAKWSANIRTFFPAPTAGHDADGEASGLADFLKTIEAVSDVVSREA